MDESLNNYKKELLSLLEKSNDSFEKQLNYVAAGAIGVSMIIVEKVIKDLANSNCKLALIGSWVLLALTLISNLISHVYTFSMHSKTIEEIDLEQYDFETAKSRNDKIKIWNVLSSILLVVGILLFIYFVSINIL